MDIADKENFKRKCPDDGAGNIGRVRSLKSLNAKWRSMGFTQAVRTAEDPSIGEWLGIQRSILKLVKRKGVQGERAGLQEDLPYDESLNNNSDSIRNGKGETLQEVLRKNDVLR